MLMIKAIIFDCFGVVIADGLEAILLRREKEDPSLREFVKGLIRKSNRGLTTPREVHEQIGVRLGITAEQWREQIYAGETRNEPLIELIPTLRRNYKTALLSNVGKGSLKHRFSDEELKRLFDVVVASGEIGFAKPDPEIYLFTAQKLGVLPEECVFIDDRSPLAQGAAEVGMQAVLYTTFEQLQEDLKKVLGNPEN